MLFYKTQHDKMMHLDVLWHRYWEHVRASELAINRWRARLKNANQAIRSLEEENKLLRGGK